MCVCVWMDGCKRERESLLFTCSESPLIFSSLSLLISLHSELARMCVCVCVRERDDVGAAVKNMWGDVWGGRKTFLSLPALKCVCVFACVCHDAPVLGRVDKAESLSITSTLGLRRDIQSDCAHGSGDIMTGEHISSCSTRWHTLFDEVWAPKTESEWDSGDSGAACALSRL